MVLSAQVFYDDNKSCTTGNVIIYNAPQVHIFALAKLNCTSRLTSKTPKLCTFYLGLATCLPPLVCLRHTQYFHKIQNLQVPNLCRKEEESVEHLHWPPRLLPDACHHICYR